MDPLTYPPVIPLLESIARVIRAGIPGLCVNDSPWLSGEPCPEGHWFFEVGTRLHVYNIPKEAGTPSITVSCPKKPEPLHPHGDAHWKIPALVQVIFARDMSPAEHEEKLHVLEMVLCADVDRVKLVDDYGLTEEQAALVATAEARLTTSDLHIWSLLELESVPLTDVSHRAVLSVEFTAICGGIKPAAP